MSLLLKKNIHPRLYQSHSTKINTSNQTTYRLNYLTEFINEQKAATSQLSHSFEQVNEHIKEQRTPIQIIHERLDRLDTKQAQLLKTMEKEVLINQAMMDQLTFQNESIQTFSKKLEDYERIHEKLAVQQQKQEEMYEQISKKLAIQEAFHETIMQELDQQKAMSEKIYTQITHLKTLFLEKITNIVSKAKQLIS